MATVIPSLMTAEMVNGSVVFLIGMRINKFWKLHKWLPVFLAVRRVRGNSKHTEVTAPRRPSAAASGASASRATDRRARDVSDTARAVPF